MQRKKAFNFMFILNSYFDGSHEIFVFRLRVDLRHMLMQLHFQADWTLNFPVALGLVVSAKPIL